MNKRTARERQIVADANAGNPRCRCCRVYRSVTLHHIVPIGMGGGRVRRRKQYTLLCRDCHDLAHRVFGPGDSYTGPLDKQGFLRAIREHYRVATASR